MAKQTKVERAPGVAARRRRAPASPTCLRDVEVHRIFGDDQRMMRVDWDAAGATAVRRPIPLSEAVSLMRQKHPPFCMDNFERPGWKYLYYWEDNGYVSKDVPDGDPQCAGI